MRGTLIVCVLSAMLAGCGGGSASGNTSTTQPTTPPPTVDASGNLVVYFNPYDPNQPTITATAGCDGAGCTPREVHATPREQTKTKTWGNSVDPTGDRCAGVDNQSEWRRALGSCPQ